MIKIRGEWSAAEDARLAELVGQGSSDRAISAALGRAAESVKRRRQLLGIARPEPAEDAPAPTPEQVKADHFRARLDRVRRQPSDGTARDVFDYENAMRRLRRPSKEAGECSCSAGTATKASSSTAERSPSP